MVYIPSISSSLALITVLASAAQAATICTVATGSSDAATAITTAFTNCANGGTVVFTKGATYNLNSLVSVTGLKGTKKWWDAGDKKAPTVLRITATSSSFSNFIIKQAPRAHIGITSSTGVTLNKITMNTVSSSSNDAHNTDAVDISNSKNIVWTNSDVTNGDDCLAINGNTSNVTLSGISCTGSHGFSVGSLGKGGETDVVSDITVKGSKCTNCQNGVRIKTWPGGKGSVSGITFSDVTLTNVDNPILITTHYCDNNQKSYCTGNDASSLTISDVVLKDISGSVSTAGNPILNVNCSTKTPCSDFTLTDISITKQSKTKSNICTNLSGSSKISYCSQ
ncbi:hypothetical protein CU098_006083 [Rhizopus stolonifer]|uniref:Exopolygalacturonase rpg16 n=1 Tax=Rhizopus stolonifer TaxID=4846 RepID=A0A367JIX5_RHIST|nr:hypothetical protein CU098_006083 [Rhizopus stolonifer]